MRILGDSRTNFNLMNNSKRQNRINYINVIYNYIQKLIENKELAINEIASSAILVNSFIKALFTIVFRRY